jgi:benzoate membrane transport protein
LSTKAPILAGGVSAITGVAASTGVVLAAMKGLGATNGQILSIIFVATAGYGLLSIFLSMRYKMPLSIVWSTPGAAMLVAAGTLNLGFPVAVGSFIMSGVLLTLTGLWPALGRLVSSIPKPIASAMLAGVIFSFCISPFKEITNNPWVVLPALLVWLVLYRFATIWAAPAAIAVMGVMIAFTIPLPTAAFSVIPHIEFTMPEFTLTGLISISIPLYLVTMASQNIPGIAIMKTYDFDVPFKPVMVTTGLASILSAPIGGFAFNLAAITAAINANEHAHPQHSKRYMASVYGGVIYLGLALLAVPFISFVLNVPHELILAMAGIALFATITSAVTSATEDAELRLPAVLTFLVGASGFAVWGIGAAFWALLSGVLVWQVLKKRS